MIFPISIHLKEDMYTVITQSIKSDWRDLTCQITFSALHYAPYRLFTILFTLLYEIVCQTGSTFKGEVVYKSFGMYKVSYFGGRLFGR